MIWCGLRHDNVNSFLGVAVSLKHEVYMVSPWVDGGTLRSLSKVLLSEGKLTSDIVFNWVSLFQAASQCMLSDVFRRFRFIKLLKDLHIYTSKASCTEISMEAIFSLIVATGSR